MTSKFLGVFPFIVIICCGCSKGNSYYNYEIAKQIQDATSSFGTAKNLNKLISGYVDSSLDDSESFSLENVNQVLIGILKNNDNDTDKCINDLLYVLENIGSEWSLKMLDSFGKPERGLLQGNTHWMGEFDECIKVYAPSKENSTVGDFHGKYCNLLETVPIYGQSPSITIGVCLPDSCDPSNEKLNTFLNKTNQILFPHSNMTDVKLTCNPAIKKLTPAAICVIFLISIFIVLALIGSSITAYEKFTAKVTSVVTASNFEQRKAQGDMDMQNVTGVNDVAIGRKNRLPIWIEKPKPFFNCFCIFTNGGKMLDTSNSEGQLPCLHGIRFLSLSWVILCHIYGINMNYTRDYGNLLSGMDHWFLQIIMNGFYSVDSFYLLSGFLLAYLFFEGASKNNGKIPWVYFYVHRYIRITPVYMIVLAFYATVFPYLSTGPLWTTSETEPCEKYWWQNLLYINNLIDSNRSCLGWSWYLSTDMQFFVISPIFLISLWRFPSVGLAILASFQVITTIVNFVISYIHKLPAGTAQIFMEAKPQDFIKGKWADFTAMIYTKPYTRISPYLVGIALAYYLYRRKQNNSSKNSWVVLSSGWLLSTTITLACLFGLYHRNMSIVEMSFYTAFNRTCFALGLAWVMYVCLTDQGGFINDILSFKPFIPLSRLTYCAYLVHPIVMYIYFNSMRSLLDFSHLTMFILFLGFLVLSYSIAFITSLLFESPVIRLDKLVRSKVGAK